MPDDESLLITRLERLAADYDTNHLPNHARGVAHALLMIRAYFTDRMRSDGLAFLRRYSDKCCTEVTRGENTEPCDKVAVAVARGDGDYSDEDDRNWWPVCAHHVRKDHTVPLADLIKALEER